MSDTIDMIVPMLQRMQSELSGIRAGQVEMRETLISQSEKLEAIEGYLTFNTGLTSRNISDVEDQ